MAVHIAADNAKAAAALVARFKKLAAALAQARGIDRGHPELRPDLRSHAVGRYVMFYRGIRGGIEVVRVLHDIRDIDQVFAAGEEEA
jgi:toxin ParE1/3/4